MRRPGIGKRRVRIDGGDRRMRIAGTVHHQRGERGGGIPTVRNVRGIIPRDRNRGGGAPVGRGPDRRVRRGDAPRVSIDVLVEFPPRARQNPPPRRPGHRPRLVRDDQGRSRQGRRGGHDRVGVGIRVEAEHKHRRRPVDGVVDVRPRSEKRSMEVVQSSRTALLRIDAEIFDPVRRPFRSRRRRVGLFRVPRRRSFGVAGHQRPRRQVRKGGEEGASSSIVQELRRIVGQASRRRRKWRKRRIAPVRGRGVRSRVRSRVRRDTQEECLDICMSSDSLCKERH
mmetsp:Transcript_30566/g.91343  ORF Transcript_30566/g.91343 Transcript_30566/m.91343 type:complete len:283 (-) Transcript_30566:501-1349(-)